MASPVPDTKEDPSPAFSMDWARALDDAHNAHAKTVSELREQIAQLTKENKALKEMLHQKPSHFAFALPNHDPPLAFGAWNVQTYK